MFACLIGFCFDIVISFVCLMVEGLVSLFVRVNFVGLFCLACRFVCACCFCLYVLCLLSSVCVCIGAQIVLRLCVTVLRFHELVGASTFWN